MQAGPFADTADDYLANACSFSLAIVMLCCLVFKIGVLTELEEVWRRMAPEQQETFVVPTDLIVIIIFACVVGALVLSFVLLLGQLARERASIAREAKAAKARRLRDKETQLEVEVPPCDEGHFHVFLSCVHGRAQTREGTVVRFRPMLMRM